MSFAIGTPHHAANLVDQVIGRLRQDNLTEVVIAHHEQFNADLLLLADGRWKVRSRQGEYLIPQPAMITDVLVKFVRLEDPNFQANVGILDLYGSYETYHKKSRAYVESNYSHFLKLFIERLVNVLTGKV